MAVEYNGTTGTADAVYSSRVSNLNIFYEVRLPLLLARGPRGQEAQRL